MSCARGFPPRKSGPQIVRTVDQIVKAEFFKEIFAGMGKGNTLGFTIFDRRQGFDMIADNGMIMG